MSAIKVVTAYSLQPQVAELYHAAAAEGGGSRSAHFSGLAFGVAQVRARPLHSPCVNGLGTARAQAGRTLLIRHSHTACGPLSPPTCAQLILFLFYCLMFWFGGTQIQDGSITFSQMNKARPRCMRCNSMLLCCPCCCTTCTAPVTREPAL